MSVPKKTSETTEPNCPISHPPGAANSDVECRPPKDSPEVVSIPDIEHVFVKDDPRKWSTARKTITLWIISVASLISSLASNIQIPMNEEIQQDLHATNMQISWTLSAFILVQGNFPLVWSAASEIKGRKVRLFSQWCQVRARIGKQLVYIAATTIFVLACAILANARTINLLIGMRVLQAAGSGLSFIYRGRDEDGHFLCCTTSWASARASAWRFYLAVLWVARSFLFSSCVRGRPFGIQAALNRRTNTANQIKASNESTVVENNVDAHEKSTPQQNSTKSRTTTVTQVEQVQTDIRLSFSDINPFPPLWKIMRRKNNVAILLANGLVFAFTYCLAYTCTRTLSLHYGYDALAVGVVLFALGIGSVGGSVIGGRWSDHVVMQMKMKNEGKWYAEMRLKSSTLAMIWLPLSVVGYGWVAEKHVTVGVICVMLFLCGFLSIWMYTCTLAYVVDANPGRACSAVATNSSFRGTLAFLSIMVAVPLQDAIGDGWLYTGFAGLVIVMELLIILVYYRGVSWREQGEKSEKTAK